MIHKVCRKNEKKSQKRKKILSLNVDRHFRPVQTSIFHTEVLGKITVRTLRLRHAPETNGLKDYYKKPRILM